MKRQVGLNVFVVVACLAYALPASAQCALFNFSPLLPNTPISLSQNMYDALTSSDPTINPALVNAVVGARDVWNQTNACGRIGDYSGIPPGAECPAGQPPFQLSAFDFTAPSAAECSTLQKYITAGLVDPLTTLAFTDYHSNNTFLQFFGFTCPECGTKSIVFNTHFAFSMNPNPEQFDIQSLLTHEFGHMLGFGHIFQNMCQATQEEPCSIAPNRNTMNSRIPPGDICMRSLSGIDIANADFLYPPCQRAAGDLNQDLRGDIVWRNVNSGAVSVWLVNGTSLVGSGSPGGAGLDWSISGVGDFNGDGKADILWRNNNSGDVTVWLMNGTGVALLGGTGSPGAAPPVWQIAGVGDFNGDGKADILWRNTSSGEVTVWLMSGTAMVGTGSAGLVTLDWSIAGVGDFNGDGRADILWRHTSGTVAVWLMNGTTVSGSGVTGSAGNDWRIEGVGKFNGDAKSDVLWRNTNSGAVSVWLMNGVNLTGSGAPGSAGLDWQVAGVADFNGDGQSDILWRQTSGMVAVWLMNGTTVAGSGVLGSLGNEWQIQ